MKIPYYQINSFTTGVFLGNPAGVCLLDSWLSDEHMQYIAQENNLSETAFLVAAGQDYEIRWFTPLVEVDLCGHATLASAYVLFNLKGLKEPVVSFHSRSGILTVSRAAGMLKMDFPVDTLEKTDFSGLEPVFPEPKEVFRGKTDIMLVYDSENLIRDMNPNMKLLMGLAERGVIVTAPGNNVDFVSRFFAPQSGIPEDPVTGSAHTTLTPFWAEKLGKNKLLAWQISKRGGQLLCEAKGDRIIVAGEATLYSSGYIHLSE
ncbi:MAG: PhzF family phenazine biosynthesis protein [Bacteroidales bacterium]|nr:PhzF family phenazine biosynthesis protein [Bacteroidales bacterium]